MLEKAVLKIPAQDSHLDDVLNFAEQYLEKMDCPRKVKVQMNVSIEELFVNVAHYAYPDGVFGEFCFEMEMTGDNCVRMVMEDTGKAFNPLEKEDPDITLSAEERQIGGLGIYMVKKSMDAVSYERDGNINRLTLVRSW